MTVTARRRHRFGARVLIRAEAVRVIGKTDDAGQPAFRQATPARDYGRYTHHDFDGSAWPGHPVAVDDDTPSGYEGAPDVSGGVFVRVRRIPLDVREEAIVLGATTRIEGTIRPGAGDTEARMIGPGRSIDLYEVALAPRSTRGKARITLVHPGDVLTMSEDRW